MTHLEDALKNITRLGIDTAPVIYFIEAHPDYDMLVSEIFQRIEYGELSGVTSMITLAEVLVHPCRKNNHALQQAYYDLLMNSRNFDTLPLDDGAARQTALLRARYGLRTPDAFQVAVALQAGCDGFLTNDTALRRIKELRIIVLDDLEEGDRREIRYPLP
jgi:predicted nucleic acid-binding protein